MKNTNKNAELKGKIHSIESLGALDGPGLRTVIFFQGCPLRCKFCHNVDSITTQGGKEYTVEELFKIVKSFSDYWGDDSKKGGVTLSGGDPLFQTDFALKFVKRLNSEKINIALDTSLFCKWEKIKKFIPFVDLWMVSLKHMNSEKHYELTSVNNDIIIENLRKLDNSISSGKKGKIRPRFLIIPGITDTKNNLLKTGKAIKSIKNIEKVEILKYGTHGIHKWKENFGKYPLDGVRSAEDKDIKRAVEIMDLKDIDVIK